MLVMYDRGSVRLLLKIRGEIPSAIYLSYKSNINSEQTVEHEDSKATRDANCP